jgi:nitroimidazol reductase NimA-like FMN-containing flavoprotein (pyridoxamine 5'-phosphate oxidase superfamily)
MIHKLTEPEIEEILKDNVYGHLGCNDGLNTYIFPINYLYDGTYITCHSQMGFKIEVMQKNSRVCLQVDEVKDDKNWKSVMVLGEYQELTDEQDLNNAMKAFSDRRLFLKISEPTLSPGSNEQEMDIRLNDNASIIYRIVIDKKEGRFENW